MVQIDTEYRKLECDLYIRTKYIAVYVQSVQNAQSLSEPKTDIIKGNGFSCPCQ